MLRTILPLAIAGAASLTAFGASAQIPSPIEKHMPDVPGTSRGGQTQTCAFDSGPRAGQTVNFAGSAGAPTVAVGSRCADMQGSNGSAVAEDTARAQSQGRYYRGGGAPNAWSGPGQLRRGYTQSCSFTSGPGTGTSKDFTGVLGAQPVRVGSPCSDGASTGVAIAPGRQAPQ
jgi:hypothetical protein